MSNQAQPFTLVVGGVNIDIGGCPHAPLVAGDSNPGRVRMSLGGVGRNIAHNLRLLQVPVQLLTAFGDDLFGSQVSVSCNALGIGLDYALRLPGEATSTYLYLTDPAGEMVLALSDMDICAKITPAYLAARLPLIREAQVVAADTNLPEEALLFLGENVSGPLFVDPVSAAKAGKLRPILSRIHTLKPNRLEAELLSGVRIRSDRDVPQAAQALLSLGVQRVFLSLGAKGVYAAQGEQGLWLPPVIGVPVNTTGCGDAFMAALVWAYRQGLDLKGSAMAGLAAASIAMEGEETIHSALCPEELCRRMKL